MGLSFPKQLSPGVAYACAISREQNTISAANFKDFFIQTHLPFEGNYLPPMHTIVVEADTISKHKELGRKRINSALRLQIFTTCGDANIKYYNKGVDPAICLYDGAYLLCTIGNQLLRGKMPRGDGTMCHLVAMKIKTNAITHKTKNIYKRKVWTINATDVE